MSAFIRFAAIALTAFATPVMAYIGPGSGISLLGSLWGLLVGIVLALAAILFWPIRLIIKRMRGRKAEQHPPEQPATHGDGE